MVSLVNAERDVGKLDCCLLLEVSQAGRVLTSTWGLGLVSPAAS
jgi:hypothetical protein